MITSPSNPRIKWVRSLQAKRRARDDEGVFVAEGYRWAEEIVKAEARASLVLCSESLDDHGRGLVNSLRKLGAEAETVSDQVMAACSETKSPQGLLVVLPRPDVRAPALDLVLVLDRLADPGNLGTIMRTCQAAGVDALAITPGSVDPYNPKVVRAAVGAHLHLPILSASVEELEVSLKDLNLWLAEAAAGLPYDQVDWRPPSALVIGGEAHGIGESVRALGGGQTHIPMAPASESLNAAVAAAVILFEIRRQRGTQ